MNDPTATPDTAPATPVKSPRLPALSRAEKLAQAAREAAEVRAYDSNPDVIAYRIERMRTRVDRLMWTGIILGLAFTAANVQQFAAAGHPTYSIPWWIAWLLDPTVSLVLLGTLLGEQVIARYQIRAGCWIRITKWTALALTYAMNTWESYTAADPAAILLHSVPPIIVFCAAEAITDLKHRITEAVHRAYDAAAARAAGGPAVPAPPADGQPVDGVVVEQVRTGTAAPHQAELPATPVPVVPVALPAQRAILGPVPDELCPSAAARYAADLAEGRTPQVRRIKDDLKIGQPRASRIRAYLGQLAAAAA